MSNYKGLPRGRELPPAHVQQESTGLDVAPLVYQPTISVPGNQQERPSVLVTNRPVVILDNSFLSRVLSHGRQSDPFRPSTRDMYSEFLGLSFPVSSGNQRREVLSPPIRTQCLFPSQEDSRVPAASLALSSALLTSVVPYSMRGCATGCDDDIHRTSSDHPVIHKTSDSELPALYCNERLISETALCLAEQDKAQSNIPIPPQDCLSQTGNTIQQDETSTQDHHPPFKTPHHSPSLTAETDECLVSIPESPPNEYFTHTSQTQLQCTGLKELDAAITTVTNEPSASQDKMAPLQAGPADTAIEVTQPKPSLPFIPLPVLPVVKPTPSSQQPQPIPSESTKTTSSLQSACPLESLCGESPQLVPSLNPQPAHAPSSSDSDIPEQTTRCLPQPLEEDTSNPVFLGYLSSASLDSALTPPHLSGTTVIIGSPDSTGPEEATGSLSDCNPLVLSPDATEIHSKPLKEPLTVDNKSVVPAQAEHSGGSGGLTSSNPSQIEAHKPTEDNGAESSQEEAMESDSGSRKDTHSSPLLIGERVLKTWAEAIVTLSKCNEGMQEAEGVKKEESVEAVPQIQHPETNDAPQCQHSQRESTPQCISSSQHLKPAEANALLFPAQLAGGDWKRAKDHKAQSTNEKKERKEQTLKAMPHALLNPSKVALACEEREDQTLYESDSELEMDIDLGKPEINICNGSSPSNVVPDLPRGGFSTSQAPSDDTALVPSPCCLPLSSSPVPQPQGSSGEDGGLKSWHFSFPPANTLGQKGAPYDEFSLGEQNFIPSHPPTSPHPPTPPPHPPTPPRPPTPPHPPTSPPHPPTSPPHPPTPPPHPSTSPPHPPTPPPHSPTPPPHPPTPPPLSSTSLASSNGQRALVNQHVSVTQPNHAGTLSKPLGQSLVLFHSLPLPLDSSRASTTSLANCKVNMVKSSTTELQVQPICTSKHTTEKTVKLELSLQEPLPKKIKLTPGAENTCNECSSESVYLESRGGEFQEQCPKMLCAASLPRQESEQPMMSLGSASPGPSSVGHNELILSTGGATVPEHAQTCCYKTEDNQLMAGGVGIREPREDADDGLDTVCQEVPRENSREHALVPNMAPCRGGDWRNSQDGSDDHCGSGGIVPAAGCNATPQTSPYGTQGSHCNVKTQTASTKAEQCEGLPKIISSEQSFSVASTGAATLCQCEDRSSIGTTEPTTYTATDDSVTVKGDQQIVPENSFNDSFNTSGFYEEQGEEKEPKSEPPRLEDVNIDELDGPTALAIVLESLDNRRAVPCTEDVNKDVTEEKEHDGIVSKHNSLSQTRSQCPEWSSVFHSRGLDRGHPQVSFGSNEAVQTTRLNLSRPKLRLGLSRKQSCLPLHTPVEASMRDRHQ